MLSFAQNFKTSNLDSSPANLIQGNFRLHVKGLKPEKHGTDRIGFLENSKRFRRTFSRCAVALEFLADVVARLADSFDVRCSNYVFVKTIRQSLDTIIPCGYICPVEQRFCLRQLGENLVSN